MIKRLTWKSSNSHLSKNSIYLYISFTFLLLFILQTHIVVAADQTFDGDVEGEGWFAKWIPYTSENKEKGILTKYNIDPALLYGTTVSMRYAPHGETKGYYLLQYLTSELEGRIESKATTERKDKVVFERFRRWRGDLLQRIRGERFLYTKMIYGKFHGIADFKDTAFSTPQSLTIDTDILVADLMVLRLNEQKYLNGFGLRFINYKIPAVTYTTIGDVIMDAQFSDTRFRSYSLSLSLLDGSRVSEVGDEYLDTLHLDDFIFYLGYAESDNSVVGRAPGLIVGMEFDSGFKKSWKLTGGSKLDFKLGLRLMFNIIETWDNQNNGSQTVADETEMSTRTEDLFVGPFASLRWSF